MVHNIGKLNSGVQPPLIEKTIYHAFGQFADKLLPFLRRGLCFVLGNPEDRFSWISLEDALRMIEFAMFRKTVSGALNVVA
jgi:NAD dependent epimerase/dehydratase family enzyme